MQRNECKCRLHAEFASKKLQSGMHSINFDALVTKTSLAYFADHPVLLGGIDGSDPTYCDTLP